MIFNAHVSVYNVSLMAHSSQYRYYEITYNVYCVKRVKDTTRTVTTVLAYGIRFLCVIVKDTRLLGFYMIW